MNAQRMHLTHAPARIALAVAIALGVAACSSTPRDSEKLDSARIAVQRAAAQSDVSGAARIDVDTAQTNLQRAEEAQKKGRPASEVDHYAYIAEQSAMAAIARHESVALLKKVETADAERSAVLLEARDREAKLAQHKAETAEMEVARVQQLAEQRASALAATTQQLDAANAQIEELKAEKTDRGMVLTLGDVLFDTGSAILKPGADRSLQQVAAHLSKNPNARLLVEGHTDSVGDDAYNQTLSRQRAESVASRLASMGVASTRISAVGLGEQYPVTGNEQAAGRQQNRRVEIIFSDNSGAFPAGAERTASRP